MSTATKMPLVRLTLAQLRQDRQEVARRIGTFQRLGDAKSVASYQSELERLNKVIEQREAEEA